MFSLEFNSSEDKDVLSSIVYCKTLVCKKTVAQAFLKEFLESHLIFSEINDEIACRILRIYIEEIDESHRIFLAREIRDYLSPSRDTLEKAVEGAKMKDISLFLEINSKFANGVKRLKEIVNSMKVDTILLLGNFKNFRIECEKSKKRKTKNFKLNEEDMRLCAEESFFDFCLSYEKSSEDFILTNLDIERMLNYYLLNIDKHEKTVITDKDKGYEDLVHTRILGACMRAADSYSSMWIRQLSSPFALSYIDKSIPGSFSVPDINIYHNGKCFIIRFNECIEVDGVRVNEAELRFINTIDVSPGLECIRVNMALVGEEGSKVKVGVIHDGLLKSIELSRKKKWRAQRIKKKARSRQRGDNSVLQYSVLNLDSGSNILIIKLKSFYSRIVEKKAALGTFYKREGAGHDIRTVISSVTDQMRIDGIIIDLRNNLGGVVDASLELAGIFVGNSCTIDSVYKSNKYGKDKYAVSKETCLSNKIFDGKLIVLVNHFSASASELFTMIIKHSGRGLVVGSKTYAKGVAQIFMYSKKDIFGNQTYKISKMPQIFDEIACFDMAFCKATSLLYKKDNSTSQMFGIQPDVLLPYAGFCVFANNLEYNIDPKEVHPLANGNIINKLNEEIDVESINNKCMERIAQGRDGGMFYAGIKRCSGSLPVDKGLIETVNIMYDFMNVKNK